MVLALARPEVHDAFPSSWKGPPSRGARSADSRPVRPSGWCVPRSASGCRRTSRPHRRAGRRQRLLPRGAGPESLRRRRRHAARDGAGARAVAPRATGAGGRRVVRAASVFGEVFWRGRGGLVAREPGGCARRRCLAEDPRRSRGVRGSRESRFPGSASITFRHGLLRDAAYAMLTESDRTNGHALAGEWLEAAGEKDALTLADHFERGGERLACRRSGWSEQRKRRPMVATSKRP